MSKSKKGFESFVNSIITNKLSDPSSIAKKTKPIDNEPIAA